jgi:hypothetical protein
LPGVAIARNTLTTNRPESVDSGTKPIKAAGQVALDILGAQLAAVTGAIDASLTAEQQRKEKYAAATKGMTPQEILKSGIKYYEPTSYAEGSTSNPVSSILAGIKNATAPTRDEKTTTSYDILTSKFGMDQTKQTIPWLNWDGSITKVDVPNLGTSGAALLSDIALDPLTYETAGISGAVKLVKGVSEFVPSALRAAELARFNEVSANAGRKVDKFTEVTVAEGKNKFTPKNATIPSSLTLSGSPAVEKRIAEAQAKIADKGTYNTVQQVEPVQFQQIIASALEAGRTAVTASLEASNATKFAKDYLNKDRVSFLKPGDKWYKPIAIDSAGVATNIVKTKDGYQILSGNKDIVLGTTSTLEEATALAKRIKKVGISGAGYKAATLAETQAKLVKPEDPPVMSTAEAVDITKPKNSAVIERVNSEPANGIKSSIAEKITTNVDSIAIKNGLAAVNKEAQAAVGTRNGIQDIEATATELRRYVDPASPLLKREKFLSSVRPEIVDMLRESVTKGRTIVKTGGYDPFKFIKNFLLGTAHSTKQTQLFADMLKSIPVSATDTPTTLGALLSSPWSSLSKEVRNDILDKIERLVLTKVQVAKNGVDRYAQIRNLFGQQIADEVKATGILDKFDEAKFASIVESLGKQSKQVRYGAVEDVIAGLRAGDKLPDAALKRIFNAMTPELRMAMSIEQAVGKPNAEFIKSILVGKAGDTIEEISIRLAESTNIVTLIKGTGIDNAGSVAALADVSEAATAASATSAIGEELKAITEATGVSRTRQKAADDLLEVAGTSEEGIAFEAMANANKIHNVRLDAIQSAEEFERAYTDMGYLADMSTSTRYADGSMASVSNRFDQNWEKDMLGSSVAIERSRAVSRAKAVARKDKKVIYNPFDPATAARDELGARAFVDEQYANVINTSKIANDYLISQSSHMVNAKLRDDINTLDAFYKQAKDGRVADKATAATPHFVYVNNGDVFQAFLANGNEQLLKDAFFPMTVGKDYEKNSFLWMNLSDATRRSMEMHSAGQAIDLAEIEYRLLNRHTATKTPSREFKDAMPELAKRIAEALNNPKVMQRLQNVHIERSRGIIDDFAPKAEAVATSLMESIRATWMANIDKGNLSETARIAQIEEAFNKFAFASDMFKFDGGPVAENLFRQSAMFMFNGGRVKLGDSAISIANGEAFADFHKALVTYSSAERPMNAAKFGEIEGRFATPAQKQAAQNKLTAAEQSYQSHVKNLEQVIDDPDGFKLWDAERARREKALDKARVNAYTKGLQTRHFDGTTWVNSELYNRDEVIRLADQNGKLVIQGKPRPNAVADSQPTTMVNLKTKATPEELAKIQQEVNAVQRDIAKTNIDNGLDEVIAKQEAGEYNFKELDAVEQSYRAYEDTIALPLAKNTQLPKIHSVNGTYESNIGRLSDRELNERFFPARNPETRVTVVDQMALRRKQFNEKWYGPSNRQDVIQIMHSNEINSMMVSARFADYLHAVRNKWADIDSASFDKVIQHIKNGTTPGKRNLKVSELHLDIKRATDMLFGSKANNAFVKNGIDMDSFAEAMGRLGIGPNQGFYFAKGAGATKAHDFLQNVPIGGPPKGVVKGTLGYDQWVQRTNDFKAANMDPFMAFSKMMQAVQMVKLEKGIMEEFAARFSHLNFAGSESAAAAVKNGFVKPAFIGDEKGLSKWLPTAEKGGLYLPEHLDQLGSMMREMHAMYSKNNPVWLRNVMEVGAFFKATQTIFRFGHHITNVVGDVSSAWIAGVVNPEHWDIGYSMAREGGLAHLNADYKLAAMKNGQDILQNKWRQIFRANEGKYKTMVGSENGEKTIAIVLYKNGKPTRVNFTQTDLIDLFEKYGIMVTNIYADDLQNLTNSLEANPADVMRNTKLKQITAGVRAGIQAVEKPVGDITAWYGNITRAAHAMKVIHSRSWGSLEDALKAATDQVNLYHPTLHSLASSERKFGRTAITYYTWLRMAHMATLDMAKSHMPALMVAPKFNYNMARGYGIQPTSIGNPQVQEDEITTPNYMKSSVYGPNVGGPDNPGIVKLPFTPLQVVDTWSFYWDPSLKFNENLIQNASRTGMVLGKNLNLIGKPLVEFFWHVDPDTGKTSQINDVRSLNDSLVSNFGFINLLKGIPAPEIPSLKDTSFFQGGYLYTPKKDEATATTPAITPEERKLTSGSFFTGPFKVNPAQTPDGMKTGISEYKQGVKNQYKSKLELEAWLKQFEGK